MFRRGRKDFERRDGDRFGAHRDCPLRARWGALPASDNVSHQDSSTEIAMSSCSNITVHRGPEKRRASGQIETAVPVALAASHEETDQKWKPQAPSPGTSTHNPARGAVGPLVSQLNLLCSRSNPAIEVSERGPAESTPCAPEIFGLVVLPRSIRTSSKLDPTRDAVGYSLPHESEMSGKCACNAQSKFAKDIVTEKSKAALIRSMSTCERAGFSPGVLSFLGELSLPLHSLSYPAVEAPAARSG